MKINNVLSKRNSKNIYSMQKKKTTIILILSIVTISILSCSSTDKFIPFGQPEIDRVRREVQTVKTDSLNFHERINTLGLWTRFMMYYGADLIVDQRHKEHFTQRGTRYSAEFAAQIDYRYGVMEEMWNEFSRDIDQHLLALKRDPADNNGEVHNWPTLRGNSGQTAATTDPGPMKGEVHWKFPTAHVWLTRPAFDNGKVYMSSPGIAYLGYCIDARTGEYIWKSNPTDIGFRFRFYGRRASSPVILAGNQIIYRRIQVAGGLEHFVFLDKETGEQQKGIINNEFLNSSSGYAPFDGNEKYIVYPQGIQPIVQEHQKLFIDQLEYRKNREDYPFDSLVCKSTTTGELLWRDYMGEFYAEPLLSGNEVFCGNTAGEFRCYNVSDGKLLWKVSTGSSINVKASADEDMVLVSNESGKIFGLNRKTGEEMWSQQLTVVPRAFQVFSSITMAGDRSYIGSADKNIYCFDTRSGRKRWNITLDDWVRSAPLVIADNLYAATLGGTMYSIDTSSGKPEVEWKKEVSEFPVLADLTAYNDNIYFTTGDFYLLCVEPKSGKINWKTSTFERMDDKKGNTIMGDITGQPDEQSSMVVVDGKGYFGIPRFVYCVDIETGKELWRFEERGQFTGAPYVSNGKLYIGQRGGTPYFYCLDAATGDMIWKKRFGHVWASANGMDRKVYLNSEGGTFYCVNEDTGDVIWQYQAGLGLSYNTPGFYQDLVYFGSNHDYYAFNRHTGELKWKYNIGKGKTDSGNFLIKNGVFYCGGMFGGQYSAVDALTGKQLWKREDIDSNTSPTTDGEYLIIDSGGGVFTPDPTGTVCLDLKTGEIKYRHAFGGLSAPAIGNNLVFMASTSDCYFRAWDIKTGEIRWRYRMGGRGEESCVTIYGDKAFILASDSYAYCFK